MYFGVESHNVWSDVIMSFMISLIATTPGFIIRKLFEYSKPKVEKHRHHEEFKGIPEFEGGRSRSSSNIQDQVTLKMVKRMRHEFYEWMFPLVCRYPLRVFQMPFCSPCCALRSLLQPPYCRNVAWVILVMWSIATFITAVRLSLY